MTPLPLGRPSFGAGGGSLGAALPDALAVRADAFRIPLAPWTAGSAPGTRPAFQPQSARAEAPRLGPAIHARVVGSSCHLIIHTPLVSPDSPRTIAMTVAALYNGLRAAEELEVASSAPPALPVSFGTASEMARDLLSAMADFAPFAPSAAGIPLAAPERDRRAVYRAAPSARTEARTP